MNSPHRTRFRVATGVLGGLGVAAVLIALGLGAAGRPASATGPATTWSEWSPPDGGALGARDIAAHIAPTYRLSAINQLVVITVVNLESAAAETAAAQAAANGTTASASSGLQVAIKQSPASGQVSLLGGNTIGYDLCGLGKNCAVVGTPSRNRLLLLRREALELALYTFRYLKSINNVVAILPPGHTETTSQLSQALPTRVGTSKSVHVAVLFDRSELTQLLAHPLGVVLPGDAPPTVSAMAHAHEAGLVEALTGQAMFSEQLEQAQDGSSLLVLNPLPPQ